MNLRSGTVAQETQPEKTKKKKSSVAEETMADKKLEQSLKAMLTEFKEEISKQIGELRQDFGTFSAELTQVRADVTQIRSGLKEANNDIKEAEQRIDELEERETGANETIEWLKHEQKRLNERLEHLENKARQNNLRIYNIKEDTEGGNMVEFIRTFLEDKLELPPGLLQIEAAYRSPSNNSQQTTGKTQKKATNHSQQTTGKTQENASSPRSIVVRFPNWNIRQQILQTAWAKTIELDEERVYFSQDFTSKVQKERSRYVPLRRLLKEKNVKSHLLYPAKLKVFGEGEPVIYATPEEAERGLREQGVIPAMGRRLYEAKRGKAQSVPFQKVNGKNVGREQEITTGPPAETEVEGQPTS